MVPEEKYLKNTGIPGDNSFGVLVRLDDILIGKPKMLFLMIGINDLAQGILIEILLCNINRICKKTKQISPKTTLIIESILPTNENFKKLNGHCKAQDLLPKINSELKILAERQQVKYLNLHTHFVDSQGLLKEEFSWNGVHLTLAGYQQWVKVIKEDGYLKKNNHEKAI
ncbi:GDSL-type esterase/lipase family protein [Sphingobacterium sp. UBA6645]|uniref:GDSL-type esterase/lipase family protein n=1 Tax=Sphingobacterium sp. UBA6645 TaxID=1947511 RepID=UPI0032E4F0A1